MSAAALIAILLGMTNLLPPEDRGERRLQRTGQIVLRTLVVAGVTIMLAYVGVMILTAIALSQWSSNK